MNTRLLARTLPFAFVGALAVLPASAQTPAPATAPAASSAPAATPAAPASTRRGSSVERRIAVLRSSLKITPAETQTFNDFAQVMRDNASQMDTLMAQRQQAVGTMTAVDAMKSYQAVAQQHLDDMQKLVPAFATLYDSLSPEQKKLADRDFQQFAGRPPRRAHS
jgi:periplasmic protein CpxP/Spy